MAAQTIIEVTPIYAIRLSIEFETFRSLYTSCYGCVFSFGHLTI